MQKNDTKKAKTRYRLVEKYMIEEKMTQTNDVRVRS